jgi:hypothetical protein
MIVVRRPFRMMRKKYFFTLLSFFSAASDKVILNVPVPNFVKPGKMSTTCIREFSGSNLGQDIKCFHWGVFIFSLSKFRNGTANHFMTAPFHKFSKYMFTPYHSTLLDL